MYINTPEVQELALRCFPGYQGRTFKVEPFQGPMRLESYWSGGSRDYWQVINLATDKSAPVPENGTPFTQELKELAILPFNCVLARHCISCGKDLGVTLYLHPDNLNKLMLPAPVELSRDEKIVLVATRSLKSSYGGISNYRFQEANSETGITLSQWDTAKSSLQARGLLNKAGAITNEGRNAAGTQSLWQFKAQTSPVSA